MRDGSGSWCTWSIGLCADEIEQAREVADVRVDSALQIVLDPDRAYGDGGRRIALRFCASSRHVAENGRLAAELSVFDRQERSSTRS